MMTKVNLYLQYLEMGKDEKTFPIKQIILIILISSLTLMGLLYANVKITNNKLHRRERELRSFVSDEDTIKKYEQAQYNESLLHDRKELYDKIGGVNNILEEKRQLSPELFEQISSSLPYGVSLKSIDFANGNAQINYESKSLEGPSLFAQNLKNRSLVKSLDYQGFTKETEVQEPEEVEVAQELENLSKLITEEETSLLKEDSVKQEETFVYRGTIELILEGGY